MRSTNNTLRPGDWVEVKPPLDIERTLDANGALDGLPFMPEMLEHVGRRFRVLRKAEKTCVEILGGQYVIRELLHNDVFLLQGLRCSGASHGGCQRLCMLFWKAAWLRKVRDGDCVEDIAVDRLRALSSRLKTRSAADRYYCQSTQLVTATRPESLTSIEIIVKCWRDVWSGAVTPAKMLSLILVPLGRKIRDRAVGRPLLRGSLKRTPVGDLALQAGEMVEIKSTDEMRQTLDANGRNRGLVCDIELKTFSGAIDRVKGRLERMISEPTGEMRTVEATVVLEGNTCMCARVVGGCPRLEYCYWRELWLRRVGSTADSPPRAPEDRSPSA